MKVANDGYPIVDKWDGFFKGARAGALTIIKKDLEKSTPNHPYYICKCDCGNTKSIRSDNISRGARGLKGGARSCGCKRVKMGIFNNGEDANNKGITDTKYKDFNYKGHKIIINDTGYTEVLNRQKIIICKCKYCHSLFATTTRSTMESCGCKNGDPPRTIEKIITSEKKAKSKGELKIWDLLNSINIPFIPEKQFSDCVYNNALRFDVFLNSPKNGKYVIEYDGEQHFKPIEFFGGEKRFKEQRKKDLIKNKYCWDNNIKIIRIPYDKYETFELNDLSVKTTRFLLTPENEEEYYESRK